MTTPRRSFRTASVHSAGRTLDLKHPQNDKDPTRNAHDFNDPQGSIADGAGEAGEQIRVGIPLVIYMLTGIDVSSWDAFLTSLSDGVGIDLPFIKDIVMFLQNLFGGGFSPGSLPTPEEAVTALVEGFMVPLNFFAQLVEGVVINPVKQVLDLAQGFWDQWFPDDAGGGPTDAVEKASYVISAVKDAVINGYTVETITADESWPGPPGAVTELIVIAVAAGEDGSDGQTVWANPGAGSANGGARGRDGSYVVQNINPADVTYPVAITIGVNGGPTSFGPYVSVSPGAEGGIATPFGYTETLSLPGDGGKGGNVVAGTSADAGNNGESSAVAGGGAGGAGSSGAGTGNAGTAGGDANPAATTKCGGGGGGGGGGRWVGGVGQHVGGGPGGDGGYPGGGGGGGGAAAGAPLSGSVNPGLGGLGAPGIMWIYYR